MKKKRFWINQLVVCVDDENTDLIYGKTYKIELMVLSYKGVAFFVEGINRKCYTPPTFVPALEYLDFEHDLMDILYKNDILWHVI